jgi:hypothetical protein
MWPPWCAVPAEGAEAPALEAGGGGTAAKPERPQKSATESASASPAMKKKAWFRVRFIGFWCSLSCV